MALSAILFCLLHQLARGLGLTKLPFDAAEYPPLLRNVFFSQSLRDFWGYRWHALFTVGRARTLSRDV
jgi:hypothetical protein